MMWRQYGGNRSPWQEMERLRREMDRRFRGASATAGRMEIGYPAINIWVNEDGALATAEVPGIDPEALDIAVVGDALTISGKREPEALEEGAAYHRQERNYGAFSRTFQLPFQVAADQVDAVYEQGVLSITLPRAAEDKPRKITVKVE